jgi:hypothetical protein
MKSVIPNDWQLPDAIARRFGDSAGRQRAMFADGHLLLVLHQPPDPGKPDRVARLYWRDPRGQWRGRPGGEGIGPLKRHVQEFAERVDKLESTWQDASTAAEYFTLLRSIAPLHRTIRNLYSTLQEARELVPEDRDLINQRDRVGEIERAIELLHGDAKNGLEFTVARQSELQSERAVEMSAAAFRLNVLAAVFLPLATLGAMFGMNLTHGLENPDAPGLFWLVVIAGLMVGAALAAVIVRRSMPATRSRRPADVRS